MKNNYASYFLLFVTVLINNLVFSQMKYPCTANGNAEKNSFMNWVTYTAPSTDPQSLNSYTPNFDSDRFGVQNATSTYSPGPIDMVNNGVDNYGGFSLPSEGSYCFSVGNNLVGAQSDAMRFTFTVNNNNKIFKFRYALVFNDGGHPSGNPSALFYVVKGAKLDPSFPSDLGIFNSTITGFVMDDTNPYYSRSSINNDVYYRKWECLEFDLSQYVGQQVSFVALVKDCTQGVHFGYMYIDGLCTAWPAIASMTLNGNTFCKEQTIMMNGASSEGEDKYFVEVAEVDANNNYVPNGSIISEWFVAQQAPSNFNVSNFINSKGMKLECGKKYKVKLAVANHCAVWNETNQYFNIVCPPLKAGPDVTECCNSPIQSHLIGAPQINGNTYSWQSFPAGFTSTSSQITVAPSANTAYIVTMTQPNGCVAKDTVIFRFEPAAYNIQLTKTYPLCVYSPTITASVNSFQCNPNPQFDALFPPNASNLNWYFTPTGSSALQFLGQGYSIVAPNADGIVTAKLLSECSNLMSTKTIEQYYRPGGHEFYAPNTFTPDGSALNDVFRILEGGLSAPLYIGDEPAYGISDFQLTIYDRTGPFIVIDKADVGRGPNDNVHQGDISWDGFNNQGNEVQTGSYNYTVDLKYCGQNEFQRVCLNNSEVDACIRWVWLFCVEHVPGCSNHFNLIR